MMKLEVVSSNTVPSESIILESIMYVPGDRLPLGVKSASISRDMPGITDASVSVMGISSSTSVPDEP